MGLLFIILFFFVLIKKTELSQVVVSVLPEACQMQETIVIASADKLLWGVALCGA